jgi:trk system potassium uptake protein TrkA
MDVIIRLKANVLICAVERGEDVVIPDGNFVMKAGDKISFIATHSASAEFFQKAGIINNSVKTAMFVGGGKLTYYLAKSLADTKMKIKIIEQNEERCRELSDLLPQAIIIHGDGSDQQLLLEEGITQTEAFASLTGFDEENIMLSLYAASQSKAKLITKVNKIAFGSVIDSLNLGSVIYPKMLTADIIVQYVRAMQNSMGSNVETLYKIVADKAEALEFRVNRDAPLLGIPLEKLKLKDNLLVACINRGGKIITPRGKDTIEAGDTVIIVTTHTGLNDLKDILR